MKRYNPWGKIWGKSKLREDKEGDYIKYEDVENIITNFINNLLHWDNARDVAQKYLKGVGDQNEKI